MIERISQLFPVWILVAAGIALFQPAIFTWFTGNWITLSLAFIMLGMGMTLSVADFQRAFKQGKSVSLASILQYTIMPFLGWTMSAAWNLPAPFAAGLILVACCPGGTASNVVTYLARADVAASVCMTAASTLMAPIMTPLLTAWLAGSRVDVSLGGLFFSAVQVVIFPVVAGVLLNRFAARWVHRMNSVLPLIAIILIVMIVASIIGAGRDAILSHGPQLLGAVFSLHALGFLLGYVFSKIFRQSEVLARTISIEVGMQNSGLGVVLARNNFSEPLTAIPSAISSAMHSVIGSLCAAYWRQAPLQKKGE